MQEDWASVALRILPLATVVALSPASIVPAVLMLYTPRPKPTGIAFLLGWLIGLAASTALLVHAYGSLGSRGQPPAWASAVRITLGTILIVVGVISWLTRRRRTTSRDWMRPLSTITTKRAGVVAVALALLNPKVLLASAATGLVISDAGLGGTSASAAVALYVVIAGSSVAIPVLAYVLFSENLDSSLMRLRTFVERRSSELVAAVLVLLGLVILSSSYGG